MYSLAEDNYMLNFGNKRALDGINIHVRWASMNSKMSITVVKGDSLYTRKRLTVRVIFSNAISTECSL